MRREKHRFSQGREEFLVGFGFGDWFKSEIRIRADEQLCFPSRPHAHRHAQQTRRDGNFEVYVMNADGSNPVRVTEQGDFDGFPDWHP